MPESEAKARDEPLTDLIYDILSDKRRRYTIHYLKQVGRPVEIRELAEQVAAWENDKPIEELDSQERKRVYISLYQGHLSTLDEKGLVDYDADRGVVELDEALKETEIYLEIVPPQTIPWSQFYVGLTVANALFLTLTWYEVGVLAELSSVAVGGVVLASFGISALFQLFSGGRIRIGDDGPPPELRS